MRTEKLNKEIAKARLEGYENICHIITLELDKLDIMS